MRDESQGRADVYSWGRCKQREPVTASAATGREGKRRSHDLAREHEHHAIGMHPTVNDLSQKSSILYSRLDPVNEQNACAG